MRNIEDRFCLDRPAAVIIKWCSLQNFQTLRLHRDRIVCAHPRNRRPPPTVLPIFTVRAAKRSHRPKYGATNDSRIDGTTGPLHKRRARPGAQPDPTTVPATSLITRCCRRDSGQHCVSHREHQYNAGLGTASPPSHQVVHLNGRPNLGSISGLRRRYAGTRSHASRSESTILCNDSSVLRRYELSYDPALHRAAAASSASSKLRRRWLPGTDNVRMAGTALRAHRPSTRFQSGPGAGCVPHEQA